MEDELELEELRGFEWSSFEDELQLQLELELELELEGSQGIEKH